MSACSSLVQAAEEPSAAYFRGKVAPILQRHCFCCHNSEDAKGDFALQTASELEDSGLIEAGDPDASALIEAVTSLDGERPTMPKDGRLLSADEVAVLKRWIQTGAHWPDGLELHAPRVTSTDWWSLKPLVRPQQPIPAAKRPYASWARTPIDAFILDELIEHRLAPAAPADRRTLIRRLYFDLTGLPPTMDEVEQFAGDPAPDAYSRLVDRLLDSPRYGERWARHWLDLVHYADTHGFDKDKVRPNAWPYRDYVIRAFNEDKPYTRFVREQIAGDHFFPHTPDGSVALGFIAAGPFDWVGQIEVAADSMEKKRVRNLDRDDMVTSTMNTFASVTVQCGRCHNHKFDPFTQEDYYSLQSVFAAVDRAERLYDVDPATAQKRAALSAALAEVQAAQATTQAAVRKQAGPELVEFEKRIAALESQTPAGARPEFGYHSRIEPRQETLKWVQVDLGREYTIKNIEIVACHDSYNNIGAGFGFPVRYRVEISDDAQFKTGVAVVTNQTSKDVPNPGVRPQTFDAGGKSARFVRVTAVKLAPRSNDYIFALGELTVRDANGVNVALGRTVTALDSIEAPVRWRKSNLVDGYFYGIADTERQKELASVAARRQTLIEERVDQSLTTRLRKNIEDIATVNTQLAALPVQQTVFSATAHFTPRGNFQPTAGTARPVYILRRGSEKTPDRDRGPMRPGVFTALPSLAKHFDLPEDHDERAARAALASWLTDRDNPLTWRSIVNRVWQFHFGRAIVDTPNDFGRMGTKPTHPELLDWLAVEFRDNGQSIKSLHRLICNSAVYRQQAAHNQAHDAIDGENLYLWRMNRRRLEAEAIRDSVLHVAGKLNLKQGGPGYRAFGFKDDHSPHYKYEEYDPDDVETHRRAIYRFAVRSVPDPFMTTFDCADASINVPKRTNTLTAVQALSLLNNRFMLRMSEHFAARVAALESKPDNQIDVAYRLAFGRSATRAEREVVTQIADEHGLANACRVIFNLNEFIFVD
ncbi:MAG: hypothetical protein CMJ48_05985 [Planctomycetaceae bacterium]|nr:hypothetical protein [Planctomycetaceae bacterium]